MNLARLSQVAKLNSMYIISSCTQSVLMVGIVLHWNKTWYTTARWQVCYVKSCVHIDFQENNSSRYEHVSYLWLLSKKICIIGVIVPFDAKNMVAIRIIALLQNKRAPLQNEVILSKIDLLKNEGVCIVMPKAISNSIVQSPVTYKILTIIPHYTSLCKKPTCAKFLYGVKKY